MNFAYTNQGGCKAAPSRAPGKTIQVSGRLFVLSNVQDKHSSSMLLNNETMSFSVIFFKTLIILN